MLTLGTISHGTLRTYDLAYALLPYAEQYLDTWPHKGDLEALRAIVDAGPDVEHEDDAEALNDALDALQEFCPPYTYIGMDPRDGSDLGVWPDIDAIEEDVRCGELVQVSDISGLDFQDVEDGQLVAIVSDHGSMTLARVRIEIEADEVWSIV